MILELAHNISVIWTNQLQYRTERNTRLYTNKICRVIRPNRPDCTLEYLVLFGWSSEINTAQSVFGDTIPSVKVTLKQSWT